MEIAIIIIVFIVLITIIVVSSNSEQRRTDTRIESLKNLGDKLGLTYSIQENILENNNIISGEINGSSILVFDQIKGVGRYKILYVTVIFEPNPFSFDFSIDRKGFYPLLRKMSGSKEFELGNPLFDTSFILKSSDENALIRILTTDVQTQLLSIEESLLNKIKSDSTGFTYEIKNGLEDTRSSAALEQVIQFMLLLIVKSHE
jgi:hypothetical protein